MVQHPAAADFAAFFARGIWHDREARDPGGRSGLTIIERLQLLRDFVPDESMEVGTVLGHVIQKLCPKPCAAGMFVREGKKADVLPAFPYYDDVRQQRSARGDHRTTQSGRVHPSATRKPECIVERTLQRKRRRAERRAATGIRGRSFFEVHPGLPTTAVKANRTARHADFDKPRLCYRRKIGLG
jgi:hypothetical protein